MTKKVTITLSYTGIEVGKRDSKYLNRSFSNYIEHLILENGEKLAKERKGKSKYDSDTYNCNTY